MPGADRPLVYLALCVLACSLSAAADFPKPYSPPCVERENVFAFTQKPAAERVGKDRYEITFAVKGNFGSMGPDEEVPVGGDGVAMTMARYVSGTDNYLVFDDWGQRLVVLKLNYHAEETVPIGMP